MITILHGTDAFQVTDALHARIANTDRDIIRLEGAVPIAELAQHITAQSLFGTASLICFKNPGFLTKKVDDAAALLSLLEQVGPNGHELICYLPGKAIDGRLKVAAKLKKMAEVQVFDQFKDWEADKVISWVSQRLKQAGLQAEFQISQALQTIGGVDLQRIDQEIKKLVAYLGETKVVTMADVHALQADAAVSVFDGYEALQRRDAAALSDIVSRLLESGVDPFYILGGLISQTRLYIQILSIVSPDAAAKRLGRHPFYIKKLRQNLSRYHDADSLVMIMTQLAEADVMIKSGQLPAPTAVLQTVAKIACCKSSP